MSLSVRAMLACGLVIASLGGGCDFLAPVVSGFPTQGMLPPERCDPPSCALLDAPPPLRARLDALPSPDDACGPAGRQTATLVVTEDASIHADELTCVDLAIEVEGDADLVRHLTLDGNQLDRARIVVHSAAPRVEMRTTVRGITASELVLDGPIALEVTDVDTRASRFSLDAPFPITPPALVIAGGILTDVSVVAPRSAVRLRETGGRGAAIEGDVVGLEWARLGDVRIVAGLLEMFDGELRDAELSYDRFLTAASDLRHVHVVRCGSTSMTDSAIEDSFVARCDEAMEVVAVAFFRSVIASDVEGRDGHVSLSVFGGARIEVTFGEILDTALCGVDVVDVGLVACARCEARAPETLCGTLMIPPAMCPGLCAARCGGAPTVTTGDCAP